MQCLRNAWSIALIYAWSIPWGIFPTCLSCCLSFACCFGFFLSGVLKLLIDTLVSPQTIFDLKESRKNRAK